jgi:hypothetical protein
MEKREATFQSTWVVRHTAVHLRRGFLGLADNGVQDLSNIPRHFGRLPSFQIEEHLDRSLSGTQDPRFSVVHLLEVTNAAGADPGEGPTNDKQVTGGELVDVIDVYISDDQTNTGVSEAFLIDADFVPEVEGRVVKVVDVVADVHVTEVVAVSGEDNAAVELEVLIHIILVSGIRGKSRSWPRSLRAKPIGMHLR